MVEIPFTPYLSTPWSLNTNIFPIPLCYEAHPCLSRVFTFTVPSALKSGVLVFLKAASSPSGLESNTSISEELALIPYLIQLHNYSLPNPLVWFFRIFCLKMKLSCWFIFLRLEILLFLIESPSSRRDPRKWWQFSKHLLNDSLSEEAIT